MKYQELLNKVKEEASVDEAITGFKDQFQADPHNSVWKFIVDQLAANAANQNVPVDVRFKNDQLKRHIQVDYFDAPVTRLHIQTEKWQKFVEGANPTDEQGRWIVANLDSLLKYIRWLQGQQSMAETEKQQVVNRPG